MSFTSYGLEINLDREYDIVDIFFADGVGMTLTDIPIMNRESFLPIKKIMAAVTGDSDIRFHDLRHSFATFHQYRLASANYEEVNSSVWTEPNKLNEPLRPPTNLFFDTPILLQRQIYETSLLCGHIDPKETISSYIHSLDYQLGQFTTANTAKNLSGDQLADLMGKTPGNLKGYKNRHKLKSVQSVDLLLNGMAQELRKNYSNPILKTMTEHTPLPQTESPINSPERYPSPQRIYSILKQHSEFPGNIEQTVKEYNFPPDQIISWINMAQRLMAQKATKQKRLEKPQYTEIRNKKSRKTTRKSSRQPSIKNYCPTPPHSHAEKRDVKKFYQNIIKQHEKEPKTTLAALRVFMGNTTYFMGRLNIKENTDRSLYVSLLKKIGLPKTRIHINLQTTPFPEYTSETVLKQQNYWADFFELPKKNIHLTKKLKKNWGKYPYGIPSIWVQGFPSPKDLKHEDPTKNRSKALRYAIFMAITVLIGSKMTPVCIMRAGYGPYEMELGPKGLIVLPLEVAKYLGHKITVTAHNGQITFIPKKYYPTWIKDIGKNQPKAHHQHILASARSCKISNSCQIQIDKNAVAQLKDTEKNVLLLHGDGKTYSLGWA